jgi:hypothetical protein
MATNESVFSLNMLFSPIIKILLRLGDADLNVVKLRKKSPSPAGEGRGEENKIRKNAYLYPPHPNLLPQGRRD